MSMKIEKGRDLWLWIGAAAAVQPGGGSSRRNSVVLFGD